MSSIPNNLKYSISHEWVQLNNDIATIGITDHAQEALGDIVFIELPKVGNKYKIDDVFGSVESVKAVSELYLPLSGEITEVNNNLEGKEALLNDDPYENWIVKIKLTNPDEVNSLLDAQSYEQSIT